MTRDKAILVLNSLSTWLGYERPITEEIVEAIKTISKHYLPSNLDEAAEDMLDDAAYDWVMGNFGNPKESLFDFDCKCFKAGAEWMAGQGEVFDGFISIKGKRSLIVIEGSSQNSKYGDNIIVQIRKKQ